MIKYIKIRRRKSNEKNNAQLQETFKQKHNAETLLNLFDDEDLIPIVNIHRRNYG